MRPAIQRLMKGAGYGVFVAGLTLSLAACDNTIEPFPEEPDAFFSIHGVLNTNADTQFVRVTPIRQTFVLDAANPVGITVTSTATSSGERVVWQDSLITLEDGSPGHLFFAIMDVEGGVTYRLDVTREDGKTTTAETTIPNIPSPLVNQPIVVDTVIVDDTEEEVVEQQIILQGLNETPQRIAMNYRVAKSMLAPEEEIDIQYDPDNSTFGKLPVVVELTRDRRTIASRLGLAPNEKTIIFKGLELEIELWSVEWAVPTSGVNIQNGVGFFGAIGHFFPTWTLSSDVIRTVGYIPDKADD